MLAIKLQRIGKKHQPSYRLVVALKRSKLGAPPVEDLGSYDPFTKKGTFKVEKIKHWIEVGAQPTVTVYNLLLSQKVLSGKKLSVKMRLKKGGDGKGVVPATKEPATAPAN